MLLGLYKKLNVHKVHMLFVYGVVSLFYLSQLIRFKFELIGILNIKRNYW